MKEYFKLAVLYICLLALFSAGVFLLICPVREQKWSDSENRLLTALPEVSTDSVLSGKFSEDFENYLSDAFPARNSFIGCSDSIMSLFGKKDKSVRDALLEEIGDDGEYVSEAEELALDEETAPVSENLSDYTAEENTDSASAESEEFATGKAGFWFVDNQERLHPIDVYSDECISYLAGVLDMYADCLDEDGVVYFINAPISEFANPVVRAHKYPGWEYTIDEALNSRTGDRVKTFDPTDILVPHTDNRNLYSTEDHHWHVFTAWYVFRDMIAERGCAPTDFYEYCYYLRNSIKNGAYTPEQLENKTLEEEDLMYQVINSPVKTSLITHLTVREPSDVYNFRYSGYTVYCGGAKGPYRLFETGYHTGRNAMVIGDSFSFCLIPYMFPYYDNVLQTDFRGANYKTDQVGFSAKKYMEEYDIDDIYIITCNGSPLDSPLFAWRMEKFLFTDFGENKS